MAAALAVSMMAPSCLPQTLWAAEFSSESAEEASEGFAEEIADNMEENENTADDAVTEPDEIVKDETEDSESAEDQDFGSDDEELTNDSDAADSADAEEVTEENNELDLSDVPEMVMEGEAAQDYLIQLYSSGKLVKSYTVSNSASAAAKAPAALKKSGCTFKEWNTKADGKGTAYKPGASISKLLQESSTAVQSEVQDIAEAQDTAQELLAEEDSAQPVELEQQSDTGLEANPAAEASAEDDKITVRLYAIWTKNASYKITYKLNGGKNHASNPKTYTIESQIKLKNPTRSGYHFVGWYKDSKYKTKISTIKKGSKGSLTLYARWTPQVSPSSKAATLTSVKGLRAKTIVATATVPKYVRSYDSYYYLVYVDSNTGKVKRAAAKITKPQTSNRKITLKVNISKNPEYAQGKFAIAVKKTKTAWALISGKSYVSSPEKLASNQKAYFVPKTKKGIQSTNMHEVTDTKSKTVFINIYASDIINAGYQSYTYNGKKYYFGGLYSIRDFIHQCNAKGIQVTAQINLNKSDNTQSVITGNSPYGRTAFYGWNTSKSSSRQTMEAMFAYLGTILGDNYSYVSNWILGNEINTASGYYYLGNVSFSKYISMYSEAFRCLYNAVRSSRASSKVFICLDNCWRQKNVFEVAYTSKATLDTFASTVSKLQKGVNWNLAYHAYSQPLTESQFWSSVNAPLLTNDANTATFITMHNIQALTNYVKSRYGSKTRVILSEQGYSSSFGGQANQAASMALAYYKAACNPMIDAFIIRSYQDEAHEVAQGLALGLKDAKGKKKTVFNVFRNMDSTSSLKYTGNVLNSKVGNWKSKVPGYSAKRVASMYRVQ